MVTEEELRAFGGRRGINAGARRPASMGNTGDRDRQEVAPADHLTD